MQLRLFLYGAFCSCIEWTKYTIFSQSDETKLSHRWRDERGKPGERVSRNQMCASLRPAVGCTAWFGGVLLSATRCGLKYRNKPIMMARAATFDHTATRTPRVIA